MLRGVGESVSSPNTYFLTFPSLTKLKKHFPSEKIYHKEKESVESTR